MLTELLAERANLVSTADFNAHRKRCSRKIHKLRKQQGLITRPSKSASPKPKQGNGEICIWQSERAWAAAMELRSALEARAGPGLRRQSLDKHGKAAKYAAQAADLDPTLDTLTLAALAQGDLYAARSSWEIPKNAYSQARLGLETLANPVCSDFIQTHVDPALKIAISRTGGSSLDTATFSRSNAKDTKIGQLVAKHHPELIAASAEPPSARLGRIEWCGHSATVQDADLARQILLTREEDAALDPTNAAQFDNVLQHWAEALDIAKDLMADADPEDELHIVSTYVGYSLLTRRIQRDDLAAAAIEPMAAVRLLDNILQTCTELAELPGVYADETLGQSIDSMTAYFKSRRCGMLARAYAQHDDDIKALALVSRAADILEGDILVHDLPVTQNVLQQWRESLKLDLKRAHGSALIHKNASYKPVSHDMSVFPCGPAADVLKNIIDTSRIQPVPVKPVFYDLAYSYINYPFETQPTATPSAPASISQPVTAQTEQAGGKKRGLFGLFKST